MLKIKYPISKKGRFLGVNWAKYPYFWRSDKQIYSSLSNRTLAGMANKDYLLFNPVDFSGSCEKPYDNCYLIKKALPDVPPSDEYELYEVEKSYWLTTEDRVFVSGYPVIIHKDKIFFWSKVRGESNLIIIRNKKIVTREKVKGKKVKIVYRSIKTEKF